MENGYSLGMGQQWIHITMFICVIIFALFVLNRVRSLGETYNMVTIGDYTALRYGEKARIPTVISILFSYCAMTGMQFVAIATILNVTLGLDVTIGIIIGWILLTLKTYFGGLKTVIWQDTFHGYSCARYRPAVCISIDGCRGWGSIADRAASAGEGDMLSVMNITPGEIMIYLLTLVSSNLSGGSLAAGLGSR